MSRSRTEPTATELIRIEKVLDQQAAFRACLARKSQLIIKRTGEHVYVAPGTIAVAKRLLANRINPERAKVRFILRAAVDVLKVQRVGTEVCAPLSSEPDQAAT